ncbi:MAG: hypothetical protein ACNA8H_07400 [Anaerolineales bacterium]
MSDRRYYGVEDLGLTAQQRQAIVQAIQALGYNNQHPNPAWRNHWRIRPDNLAVIFEAAWNTEDWTIENVKNYLANAVNVDPNIVDHRVQAIKYGDMITFSVGTTDYLRIVAFGGFSSNYEQSHEAVLEFLFDFKEQWGEVEL